MGSKNLFRLAVLVLAGLLSLSGCRGNGRANSSSLDEKKELVISVGYNLAEGNYDPCTGFGDNGFLFLHSALYQFDKDVNVTPDLATGHTVSEDLLTYTYTLREDARFSDGEPLTAEDVVFTYRTAKESGSSVDLSKLEKVETQGDYTVVFTLSQPWSTFVQSTAQLGIVPAHAYGPDYGRTGIGTGPFRVLQLDVDQQLILAPNEYYYGEKPHFERITILTLDEQVALSTARSGVLDLLMINPEYIGETVEGMHLVSLPTVDNRGISLPVVPLTTLDDGTQVGNDVTSDPAIRQALNIGINRVEIIQNALNGVGVPAYGRADSLPWHNTEYHFTDGQVEEAINLLEAAGWTDSDGDGIREKDGLKASFNVVGSASDLQRYNLAVATAQSARVLGIEMTVEALSWDEGVAKSRTGGFVWGFGDYNPSEFYYWYHSESRGVSYFNPSSYANPVVDELIDKALGAASQEEAIQYFTQLQYDPETETGTEIDLPFLWLVNIDHTYLVREGLDLGEQLIHPHGHGMPVIGNMNEWTWQGGAA